MLRSELLHELFECRADTHADSVALDCAEQRMTYSELECRANQFARFLRSRGVRRGDCVGLWLERSADAYIALLGILKAGAAYVPLDPDYPPERISFILSDCRARLVVTTGELAAGLKKVCHQSPAPRTSSGVPTGATFPLLLLPSHVDCSRWTSSSRRSPPIPPTD